MNAGRSARMIEFDGVSKIYRSSKATKVIVENFSGVFPRRNIGLMGLNGAGKSTLLRLISGAEFPDKGVIRRNVRVSFPLGFSGSFKGNLSGRENCRFVARIYGLDVTSVEDYVEDFADIGKYFDMPVATYSTGMKGRVSFGVSMAVDFECYLVDETLSVGDASFKARCAAVLAEKRARASVIMVSHSLNTLKQYCDMGAVLGHGKLTLYDTLNDAVTDYRAMTRSAASPA